LDSADTGLVVAVNRRYRRSVFGEVTELYDDAENRLKETATRRASAVVLVAGRSGSEHGLDVGFFSARSKTPRTLLLAVKGVVFGGACREDVVFAVKNLEKFSGIKFSEVIHALPHYEYTKS